MPPSPPRASGQQPPADPRGDPHDLSHEQGSPASPGSQVPPGQQESAHPNGQPRATSNFHPKPPPIIWSFDRDMGWYDFRSTQQPTDADVRKLMQPFLRLLGLGDEPVIHYLSNGEHYILFAIRPSAAFSAAAQEKPPSYVLRAARPTQPYLKTVSEVATMRYVRQHTTIPVPQVYAFDPFPNNAIGHEWMLISMVEGAQSWFHAQYDMDFEQLENVARTIADWVDQLSRLRFNGMGSLYDSGTPFPRFEAGTIWLDPSYATSVQLGPLVSEVFEGDWRQEYTFDRGPYKSVAAYARGFLEMHKNEVNDRRQWLRAEMGMAIERGMEEGNLRERAEAALGRPLDPFIDWAKGPYRESDSQSADPMDLYLRSIGINSNDFHKAKGFCLRLRSCLFGGIKFTGLSQDLTEGPPTCSLHHNSICCNNVLIDNETKMPAALIDWEMTAAVPLYMVKFYPSLFISGPSKHALNDDLKADSHLRFPEGPQRTTIRRDYLYKLLRDAFRDQLARRNSPYLALYEFQHTEYGFNSFDPDFLDEPKRTMSPGLDDWRDVFRHVASVAHLPMHYAREEVNLILMRYMMRN